MANQRALSKAEMVVARALWKIGPATVRQIYNTVSETETMDFSTVQTYLRRIEDKGYARSRLDGRLRVFSTRTRPLTVIRDTVNELVDRLFDGESLPLVQHLIEERGIDEAGLAELRKLIERCERKGSKDA